MELQKQNRDAVVASSKLQTRKMGKGKIKANVKFPVIWSVYSWGVHFKLDEDYDFFPMSSISPHFWGQPHSIVWALALLALISTYVLESVLSIGGWQGHLIWWDENLISDWGLMLEMDVLDKRIGVLNPGLPFSTGYYLSVKVKECNMAFTTSHNWSGKNTIWIQCHWPICASEFTQ